jgi:hypothetical protein
MARCERGYLCTVCGQEVEQIIDSDLYLRYVLGEVEWEALHKFPERHIRCDPILAQFIRDGRFAPVRVDGVFSKDELDADFVRTEEERVTRGYSRLHELQSAGIPIGEYPLPEVLSRREVESRDGES